MQDIEEILRLPSPAPRPAAIAFDGDALWIGAWDTQRIYAIDPQKWTVREESPAPGRPFGLTVLGDELRLLAAIDDDDRYIYRFVPGHGVKNEGRIPCPELTGSHLAYDGDTLFLSQNANKRILSLDGTGKVLHEIPLARRPLGMTIVDGCFLVIAGDDENDDVRLTKIDARGETPVATELSQVPFDARGLAFDGSRFWTNHRDNNEIVAFTYRT